MELFENYLDGAGAAYDEMFDGDRLRGPYETLAESFGEVTGAEVQARAEALTTLYLEQGVTFDIGGEERAFPLDIMPRVIEQDAWSVIDQGVQQRVKALELFLDDVYDAGRVFDDGVVPRRVVTTSSHFHRVAAGVKRPNGVRIHVAGIDLIRDDQRRLPGARGQRPRALGGVLRDDQPAGDLRGAAPRRSPATGSGRSAPTRAGCSTRCAPAPRPASTTRRSWCSPRASTTAPTSSTRCSPARWASSWSRAATWSASAAG